MAQQIKVGDRVKSFDRDDHRSGYIGKVVAVSVTQVPEKSSPGGMFQFESPRCAILVENQFNQVRGVFSSDMAGKIIYPPMNGEKTTNGRAANEIELYDEN
jgi:hypothetical protein